MGAGDCTLELDRTCVVVDLIWESGEDCCEVRVVYFEVGDELIIR